VIKAFRVASGEDVQASEVFRNVDFHLLDAHHPELRGGTGSTFEWDLVHRRHSGVPLILSGGLTPENVGAAIAAVRPFAVDVASGTELAPGVKDPRKIQAFAAAVRATEGAHAA
jgi:phosphoribosylanthranilate isomerase